MEANGAEQLMVGKFNCNDRFFPDSAVKYVNNIPIYNKLPSNCSSQFNGDLRGGSMIKTNG